MAYLFARMVILFNRGIKFALYFETRKFVKDKTDRNEDLGNGYI